MYGWEVACLVKSCAESILSYINMILSIDALYMKLCCSEDMYSQLFLVDSVIYDKNRGEDSSFLFLKK